MEYKLEKPLKGSIGIEKYKCTIEWRNGKLIADEPTTSGGTDAGPDPYTLLLSSLASCTLITLRMYIDRKGWDISEIIVNANLYQELKGDQTTTFIDRDISFSNEVDEEKKIKLQEIAKLCPISKILMNTIEVRTFIFKDSPTEKKINYSNEEITIIWKPEFCQHSKRCWTQLPGVFNPTTKKWINPNGATSTEIIEQVGKCPSGALTYHSNNKP